MQPVTFLVRIVGAATLILATTIALAGPAAGAAYDSSYQFESAFLGNLKPGDTGTLSVFFANIGSVTWVVGTTTQVNLAACRDDKVTCNVPPEEASWNPGSWLSTTAYATHAKTVVASGDFSAFTYSVKVPSDAVIGSYRFNGDLVVASNGAKIHPEGYFQDATVSTLSGVSAPNDVQVQVGSFDGGATNNDVRVFFTAPASNPVSAYEIQRAPGHCGIAVDSPFWFTVTTLTLAGGVFGAYNDLDRSSGFYCYQVRVKSASGSFVYSKQVEATVFGAATTTTPTSTGAVLQSDAGSAGTLDAGDRFVITFSDVMQLSSPARIRVTDADCGAPSSQSGPPATCAAPVTQTVSDINCGTNASCVLGLDGKSLTVTMNASPVDVISGSAPGSQYPVVFTDSTGITNTGGTPWSLKSSVDRVVGPVGQ